MLKNICTAKEELYQVSRNQSEESSVCWDIISLCLLNVNKRFGETYGFHLQG
jgi:hypothetical protein